MFARQNAKPERAVSTSCFEVTPSGGATWAVLDPAMLYPGGAGAGDGDGEGDGVGDGEGDGVGEGDGADGEGDGDGEGVRLDTEVWYAPAAR